MNWQVFRSPLLMKLQAVISKANSSGCNTPTAPLFNTKNLTRAAFLDGIYNLIKPPEQLEDDVKRACDNTESAIVNLMTVIKQCIHEISEEYRVCIQKQIDIISSATEIGPIGKHWDDLTKYRVQASDLKQELDNYRALLKSIGSIAHEQSVVSLLTGAKDTLELIAERYTKLNEIVEQEYSENFHYELSLLYANRDHILRTSAVLNKRYYNNNGRRYNSS